MKTKGKYCKYLAPVGYAWGVALAISGGTVLFLSGAAEHSVAQLPFMKNHPVYSGGEVVREEKTPEAIWRIHRPVFDRVLSESDHGFVQIDVLCKDRTAKDLKRTIDYNNDGTADFELSLPMIADRSTALTPLAKEITGLERNARTKTGWIVRISIDK